MSAVLGTNTASIWASKNLQSAQGAMASSVERLSSGLRINRAKDDAAGLGIANALTQQINGANQGIRNLNDGISIVQTAEGAINAASEMAQRILTLATQGANGSVSQDGRTAIVNEMKQMISSINSIAKRTQYAGMTLLNVADAASVTDNKLTITSTNQSGDTVGLTNSSFLNIGATFAVASTASASGAALGGAAAATLNISNSLGLSAAQLQTYDYAYKVGADGTYSTINLTKADATSSSVKITSGNAVLWAVGDVLVFEKGQLSKDGSDDGSSLVQTIYHSNLTGSSASDAASKFAELVDAAGDYITNLNTQRAELGALQNQMEYAVSNVTELSANLTSARSRVQDTDYASETATLTKGQILQQAATAMLAQANQMPNVILSLLK
jgi:flagellin